MATTPTFTTGLLGYDPVKQSQDQQKLWANMYSQAQSPYAQIGMGLGQLLGAGVGMLTGKSAEQKREETLLNLQKEANTKFTPGTPEYYNFIAESIPPEYVEAKAYAAQAAQQALTADQEKYMKQATYVEAQPSQVGMISAPQSAALQNMIKQAVQANNGQPLTDEQVAKLQNTRQFQQAAGLVSAAEAGTIKAEGAPETAADKVIYQNLIKKTGDPLQAALQFREYKANLKQRENTPLTAGNVNPSDIATFVTNVETQLKPAQTKLNKYNELRGFLDLAAKGNAQAVPQIERWLVTAAGDNQIGAAETKRIANAGGIAERTVGGVQSFIVGTPTTDKLKKINEIVDTLEGQAGSQFNKTREKLVNTWGTSKLPPETLTAQLGTPYLTAAEKRKRAQAAADEATRQQGQTFQFTPVQNDLLKKYSQPVKK